MKCRNIIQFLTYFSLLLFIIIVLISLLLPWQTTPLEMIQDWVRFKFDDIESHISSAQYVSDDGFCYATPELGVNNYDYLPKNPFSSCNTREIRIEGTVAATQTYYQPAFMKDLTHHIALSSISLKNISWGDHTIEKVSLDTGRFDVNGLSDGAHLILEGTVSAYRICRGCTLIRDANFSVQKSTILPAQIFN